MIGQAKRLFELQHHTAAEQGKTSTPVITFASGKGGTGKSFLAQNIALTISRQGAKVLLVDMDVNLSSLHLMFNITPGNSIYSFLTGKVLFDEIIVNYSENLHLIFGASGKLDHPLIDNFVINSLLEQLRSTAHLYDFILIDSSSGIGENILALLLGSDQIIIVSTTEPTSVMDAYVILKLLKHNNCHAENFVLVNRAMSEDDGETAYQNIKNATEHFLKITPGYMGLVENSQDVSRSIIKQIPFVECFPESNLCRRIFNISNIFVKNKQVANNSL